MSELDSTEAIRAACRRLLQTAGIDGVLPTPVERIVAAAELEFGDDDLFADGTLDRAPGDLGEKIRALRGKWHALLDRRERKVYINPDIQIVGRRNFNALHEVGHDILRWQSDLAFADDGYTLSPLARQRQEREAHVAAAELLFQGDFFTKLSDEYRIGMAEVIDLSQQFGASQQAGLRRFAEKHHAPVAAVVLDRSPVRMQPVAFKRAEAVSSPAWRSLFPPVSSWPRELPVGAFPFVAEVGRLGREPLPIAFTTNLPDVDGQMREVHGELVSNHYKVLVLLWIPQRSWMARRRRLASEVRPR